MTSGWQGWNPIWTFEGVGDLKTDTETAVGSATFRGQWTVDFSPPILIYLFTPHISAYYCDVP